MCVPLDQTQFDSNLFCLPSEFWKYQKDAEFTNEQLSGGNTKPNVEKDEAGI